MSNFRPSSRSGRTPPDAARRAFASPGLLSLLLMAAGWSQASAAVQVAPLFVDHAVLQRDCAVPVWGTGTPGERLTITFREQTVRAEIASDGTWSAALAPLKAGGPDTLVISGSDTLLIEDVLVGEVWLGAGQSNMAVAAGGVASKGDEVMAALLMQEHPQVRIHLHQQEEWKIASSTAAPGLPATAYAFAITLAKRLGIPVGIVVRAIPGSATDFWISEEALLADATCHAGIVAYAEKVYPALQRGYEERRSRWQAAPAGSKEPEAPVPPGKPAKGAERLGRHFNHLIRPLIPFAIRGILWDQGENMSTIAGAERSAVNAALVQGWRRAWKCDDLPFIYMQKPSGGGCAFDPSAPLTSLADAFAPLPPEVPRIAPGFHRDIYLRLLSVPGTGMVMTSDLGAGTHPLKKSSYGQRAADVALALAYGQPGELYGPRYLSHAIEGERIRVRFSNLGQGLVARHDPQVRGFMIADASKVFHWAEAIIAGDSVLVSHPRITAPVAVRYAWADEIPWANLFNADGLPAQAFRTDTWER